MDAFAGERGRLADHNELLRTYARRQAERVQVLTRQWLEHATPGVAAGDAAAAAAADIRGLVEATEADVTSDLDFMEAQHRKVALRHGIRRQLAAERHRRHQEMQSPTPTTPTSSTSPSAMPPTESPARRAATVSPASAAAPAAVAASGARHGRGASADHWPTYDTVTDDDGSSGNGESDLDVDDHDDWAAGSVDPCVLHGHSPHAANAAALRQFIESEPLLRECERLLQQLVTPTSEPHGGASATPSPLPPPPSTPAAVDKDPGSGAASPMDVEDRPLDVASVASASAVASATGHWRLGPSPPRQSPSDGYDAASGADPIMLPAAAAGPSPVELELLDTTSRTRTRTMVPGPAAAGSTRSSAAGGEPRAMMLSPSVRGAMPRRLYDLAMTARDQTADLRRRLAGAQDRERQRRAVNQVLDAKISEIAHRLSEDRSLPVCGSCGRRCRRCTD